MKKIFDTFRQFPEIIALPCAVLVFWLSPRILHQFDSSAGVVDTGMLQFLFLSIPSVLLFNLLSFLGIKYNFKHLYQCYIDGFLEPQSFWRFVSVWAVLMLSFALVLNALV
jgi:hypothetical protein